MKKGIGLVLGFAIVAGAGGGGYYVYNHYISADKNENSVYVELVSDIIGYSSGAASRFGGVVEAQETVKVQIASGRKVTEVQVEEGETVQAGQLLFEYDLSSIEDDLRQANLELKQLENSANSIKKNIATYEKYIKEAKTTEDRLTYEIDLETAKMNLQENSYKQEAKKEQIADLEKATTDTAVYSTIEGIIQKVNRSKLSTTDSSGLDDDYSWYGMDSGNDDSFITILSTGEYRVKGKINEQNINDLIPGESIIVRSRLDETKTWNGVMGTIDRQNATQEDNDDMFFDYGSDPMTSSSSYPFYVALESSEGLMLGQHVYIERDLGQEDGRSGIWLPLEYVVDAESNAPYVWCRDADEKLEMRPVTVGAYDEDLMEYEIVDGITIRDYIAYPEEDFAVGMPTTTEFSMDEELYDDASYYDDEEDFYNADYMEDEDGVPIDMDEVYDEEYFDDEMYEDIYADDDWSEDVSFDDSDWEFEDDLEVIDDEDW